MGCENNFKSNAKSTTMTSETGLAATELTNTVNNSKKFSSPPRVRPPSVPVPTLGTMRTPDHSVESSGDKVIERTALNVTPQGPGAEYFSMDADDKSTAAARSRESSADRESSALKTQNKIIVELRAEMQGMKNNIHNAETMKLKSQVQVL